MKRKALTKPKSDSRQRVDDAATQPDQTAQARRRRGQTEKTTRVESNDGSNPSTIEPLSVQRVPSSGTLSDHSDTDDLPVTEAGLSVQPEQLGLQFIRDATEQDNFESRVPDRVEADPELVEDGFEPLDSDATLEAASQRRGERSEPALGSQPIEPQGQAFGETTKDASLFDQAVSDEDDVLESNDEVGGVLSPTTTRGPRQESEVDDDAVATEKERERQRLRRLRPRSGDRSKAAAASTPAGGSRPARKARKVEQADQEGSKQRLDEQADEAVYESFPASDPPATNAGSIGGNR